MPFVVQWSRRIGCAHKNATAAHTVDLTYDKSANTLIHLLCRSAKNDTHRLNVHIETYLFPIGPATSKH